MNFYIVRHGETDANKEGRLQGQIDIPLNHSGIAVAEETGKGMKGIHFDIAFSSSLSRAKKTAQILLKNSGNENCPLVIDERIKEINAGTYEGKVVRGKGCEVDPESIKSFFENPLKSPLFPEGETATDVVKRTTEFLLEMAKTLKVENVLVVSHGCAIRAMLNFLYEDKSNFWQNQVPHNCCVNVVSFENGMFRLVEKDKIYYDSSKAVDYYNS